MIGSAEYILGHERFRIDFSRVDRGLVRVMTFVHRFLYPTLSHVVVTFESEEMKAIRTSSISAIFPG